ncbi:osteoblast specific factor 2-related protein [Caenispirillum salinarum AK4]|uniref:Osteoblast specific factor 2-related protein n=1 Tax=Caenispirillum salinarum AK4 TaxID=1238182 RepID=K9GU69_9PROT|nr:fasciclin domain-containing protein [Caenispirillum salinarum]EKV28697.1 osteoblast specific factor 2-related protein [Caenispirillum salinarum AK4]
MPRSPSHRRAVAAASSAVVLSMAASGPAAGADLLETLRADDRFDRFAGIVEGAGMADALVTGGPYTLFAPTDGAFDRLPEAAAAEILRGEPDALRTLVRRHLVPGAAYPSDSLPEMVHTLADERIDVAWEGRRLTLYTPGRPVRGEAAQVVIGDIQAGDSVIHGISAMLLPQEAWEAYRRRVRKTAAEEDAREEGTQEADATAAGDATAGQAPGTNTAPSADARQAAEADAASPESQPAAEPADSAPQEAEKPAESPEPAKRRQAAAQTDEDASDAADAPEGVTAGDLEAWDIITVDGTEGDVEAALTTLDGRLLRVEAEFFGLLDIGDRHVTIEADDITVEPIPRRLLVDLTAEQVMERARLSDGPFLDE